MEQKNVESEEWLYEISPRRKLIDLNFKEIWHYRDLLFLFVKRNIITVYKQTILGPLWYLIQPLFTAFTFTLVFNNIANISTGKVPAFLFNMAGITAWNYFSQCFTLTSNTFSSNAGIFSKVYFPRVIVPLSSTISNLIKYGIQLLILAIFYIIYNLKGAEVYPNNNLLLFPIYVIILALIGLGFGMVISAFTTKYRDLNVLVGFATSLLVYISAVPYSLEEAQNKMSDFIWLIKLNPLTYVIEGFRYMLFDEGYFTWFSFSCTLLFSVVIFLIGLIIFNRTEKNFIDTV